MDFDVEWGVRWPEWYRVVGVLAAPRLQFLLQSLVLAAPHGRSRRLVGREREPVRVLGVRPVASLADLEQHLLVAEVRAKQVRSELIIMTSPDFDWAGACPCIEIYDSYREWRRECVEKST